MRVKKVAPQNLKLLEEMKQVLLKQVFETHGRAPMYGGSNYDTNDTVDRSPEMLKCREHKDSIIKAISKEVELYAVERFKVYGVAVVPVCKRTTGNTEDTLDVQLRVDKIPEIGRELELVSKRKAAFLADVKTVEKWYEGALEATLQHVQLPLSPAFKK